LCIDDDSNTADENVEMEGGESNAPDEDGGMKVGESREMTLRRLIRMT
jgi:hypothetical protein